MKYTIRLLDTATGYDAEPRIVTEVIDVGEHETAENVASVRADERGLEDQVAYLVVGIERGEG